MNRVLVHLGSISTPWPCSTSGIILSGEKTTQVPGGDGTIFVDVTKLYSWITMVNESDDDDDDDDVLPSGTIIVGQGPTSSVASGNDDDGSDDGDSDSDSTDLEMPPWQEEYLKRLMLREQLEKHPWKVYSCCYLLFSFPLSS